MTSEDDKIAVVSFLFDTTSSLVMGDSIGTVLDYTNDASHPVDLSSAFSTLGLEEAPYSRYFYFRGSLTVPDCTQDVDWFVFEHVFSCPSSDVTTL